MVEEYTREFFIILLGAALTWIGRYFGLQSGHQAGWNEKKNKSIGTGDLIWDIVFEAVRAGMPRREIEKQGNAGVLTDTVQEMLFNAAHNYVQDKLEDLDIQPPDDGKLRAMIKGALGVIKEDTAKLNKPAE